MIAGLSEGGFLVTFGKAYDARGDRALRRERLLNGSRAFARVVARRPIRTGPHDSAASALCAMPELHWHVVAAPAEAGVIRGRAEEIAGCALLRSRMMVPRLWEVAVDSGVIERQPLFAAN